MEKNKKAIGFKDYAELKLGFSTQNFLKCMPVSVENLEEIIIYASSEGYSFIELRDPEAALTLAECKSLAETAVKNDIEVLYEINTNLLAPGFMSIFERGLTNTAIFKGSGILRTLISNTEFAGDPNKKGWTKQELDMIVGIADNCGKMADENDLRFIVENGNEAFFGNGTDYFGFADFFDLTYKNIGLQFDTANPFQNISREKSDPVKVEKYLDSVSDRWITTHLKSGKDGVFQPVLDENPLDLGKVLSLMNKHKVPYVAFELASVSDKTECFMNHSKSVKYLIDRGLVKL
jgi:sugar phosphate isomerase/epimerase